MMKKIIALIFATLVAATAQAQETPDVLIKQVTEDVLEIVRNDKDIQAGNTQKAIDLVDKKVLPHWRSARIGGKRRHSSSSN